MTAEPTPSPAPIRFGAFVFATTPYRLSREGAPVDLPPRAALLLELLASRPGSVIPREAIREALWPDGTWVEFDRNINVTVQQLRKILRDDAKRPRYIETVPRRGYRFVATVEPVAAVPAGAAPADAADADAAPPRRRSRPTARAVLAAVAAASTVSMASMAWLAGRPKPEATDGASRPIVHTYLAAEQLAARSAEADQTLGLAMLDRVIGDAPSFAPAHLAKARALYDAKWSRRPLAETVRAIERHVRRAHALGPRSTEPLVLQAGVALRFRMDPDAAEALLAEAMASDPAQPSTLATLGFHRLAGGQPRSSVDLFQAARRHGGAGAVLDADLAYAHLHTGDLDAALEHALAGFRGNPNTLFAPWILFETRLARGEHEAALRVGNLYSELVGWPASGSLDAWYRRLIARWQWSENAGYRWWGSELALVEDRLGDREQALATLAAACERRSGWSLAFVLTDPRFATLRSDPGFATVRTCLTTPVKVEPFALE